MVAWLNRSNPERHEEAGNAGGERHQLCGRPRGYPKEFSELGKELQNALNNTEYNSEKLFADGGKMRKELNFQSGTDAESSLKLI